VGNSILERLDSYLPNRVCCWHHPGMSEENSLWKGRPSQWLNFGVFLTVLIIGVVIVGVCVHLTLPAAAYAVLLLPSGWAGWKYLLLHSQEYELTTERLRYTRGVINQQVNEIELYRVKDTVMVRKWWMRLTGLTAIELISSERSIPDLIIPAVSGGAEMRELLRKQVEFQRDMKHVRETDLDEAPVGDGGGSSLR